MGTTGLHSHGLAGDEITPDWAPLTDAEVVAVLDHYALPSSTARVVWRSPRPLSAAAQVVAGSSKVFVKRHHESVRDATELATEHAFMAHLRMHGLPIPDVLTTTAGDSVVTRGQWSYEVHAIARGLDIHRDRFSWEPLTDLAQARTAGHMLARLHQASANFPPHARHTHILVSRDELLRADNLVTTLQGQFPQRPALAAYLARHDWPRDMARLIERQRHVQPRLATQPRLWTHNDWHVTNLFWSDNTSDATITAVLDFGLAAPTFALYDLATAIERNAIAWLQLEHGNDIGHPDTANALVDGYAEVLPLTLAERQWLADLLPVVHLDFAVSEIEYFHGITHHTEHADVAYRTFLLGHAHWFDTPQGQRFTQAIAG
ncbi:MAG TPA: phosphotransferase [Rhodanobacteraceae bacterium]